jgi:hypothetical protein
MYLFGNVLGSLSFFRLSPSSSWLPSSSGAPPALPQLPSPAAMSWMHLRLSGPIFLNVDVRGNPGVTKITAARFRASQNRTESRRKHTVGSEIRIDFQPQWGWSIGRDLSLALALPCLAIPFNRAMHLHLQHQIGRLTIGVPPHTRRKAGENNRSIMISHIEYPVSASTLVLQ